MAETRFRVGDRVRFRRSHQSVVEGVVSEDRGPLGVGGRRLYGIKFLIEPEAEEVSYVELPAENLELVRAAAAG